MKKMSLVLALASLVLAGCIERELTVNTVPTGAVVTLNDEEIGQSPVSTNFQWYGDYNVRISKAGYETLVTHQKIKRPLHDYFPLDFFATIWPGKIKSKYEWKGFLEVDSSQNEAEQIERFNCELYDAAGQGNLMGIAEALAHGGSVEWKNCEGQNAAPCMCH